jgi:hypothetical protein
MSLDHSKLQNLHLRGQKRTARCPACAESGHDRNGDHLVVDTEGRFACVVYPGDSAAAKAHRKRILALCGRREIKPLCVSPARTTEGPGRLIERELTIEPLKAGLLGRLGRAFKTHLERSRKINEDNVSPGGRLSDGDRGVLTVLEPTINPNRPLSKRELSLLRRAGVEGNPMIIEALNIFDGRIVG